MLSYSWNILDNSKNIKINTSDYDSLIDLLAKLLSKGSSYLIKRGLDRTYTSKKEEYRGIKGKLDLNESLKKNLLNYGKSICEYDFLDFNNSHNQVIKATIHQLLHSKEINKEIHKELKETYKNLHKVELQKLSLNLFNKIHLNKNNKYYVLMISICRMIFDNSVVDESSGNIVFQDFKRDDRKMARLFESFIFNFYKNKSLDYSVAREIIDWNFNAHPSSNTTFLPKMKTDITLKNSTNKIIIDAKYYSKTLINNFNKEIFHSSNLYQLFSYLINQESTEEKNSESCTGILLYPEVEHKLNEIYYHKKHKIILKTIDLNRNWIDIEIELLDILTM